MSREDLANPHYATAHKTKRLKASTSREKRTGLASRLENILGPILI